MGLGDYESTIADSMRSPSETRARYPGWTTTLTPWEIQRNHGTRREFGVLVDADPLERPGQDNLHLPFW